MINYASGFIQQILNWGLGFKILGFKGLGGWK